MGPRTHLLSRSRLLQQYHEGVRRHLHLLDSWWLLNLRCLTDKGQQALSQSDLQFWLTLSHCSFATYMVCLMLLLCALVCCCSACYARHLQMESSGLERSYGLTMRSMRQHLCRLCGPCMHVSGVAAQDLLIRSAADAAVLNWDLACQLHTGRQICPCRQLDTRLHAVLP